MYALVSLSVAGVLALMGGLFNLRKLIVPIAVAGLLLATGLSISSWNVADTFFPKMMQFDPYAISFTTLICVISALVIILFSQYREKLDIPLAETVALLLFSAIGGVVMVSFTNLSMLFLGIEILSISLYILAGAKKRDYLSNEAAIKYFLMGAFATGFLLFGVALVYGVTGSFILADIKAYIVANNGNLPNLFMAGIFLMMVGMAFKISAVPFQFWTPDVYTGAPSLVTAFMATVVKTAGVAALFRLFSLTFADAQSLYVKTFMVISALTMTVGNVSAVFQSGFKRTMAYSSIAHAGYLLLAVLSNTPASANAILLYAAAYSFATIIGFTGLVAIQDAMKDDSFDSFNGLAKKNPLLAFGITVAMLSLAGIPPAAGFIAKFSIFSTAISQGYIWLVVIAVLNSAVGIYYYFKVIIAMYMKPAEEGSAEVNLPSAHRLVLILGIIATILLGIAPGLFTGLI